ncbi:hypothetical protein HanIR_Chr07g0311361 [Helianthus annuus]|nr:hypothetical protein HanIR_Chr07g0311361 [Helianthus annuus]
MYSHIVIILYSTPFCSLQARCVCVVVSAHHASVFGAKDPCSGGLADLTSGIREQALYREWSCRCRFSIWRFRILIV